MLELDFWPLNINARAYSKKVCEIRTLVANVLTPHRIFTFDSVPLLYFIEFAIFGYLLVQVVFVVNKTICIASLFKVKFKYNFETNSEQFYLNLKHS